MGFDTPPPDSLRFLSYILRTEIPALKEPFRHIISDNVEKGFGRKRIKNFKKAEDDYIIDPALSILGNPENASGIDLCRELVNAKYLDGESNYKKTMSDFNRIQDRMRTYDLIAIIGQSDFANNTHFKISENGKKIRDNGGWLNHLKESKKQSDKLKHDAFLSKWQAKTFWPILIGAAIGGIMGAISLLSELNLIHLPKHSDTKIPSVENTGNASIPDFADSSKTRPTN